MHRGTAGHPRGWDARGFSGVLVGLELQLHHGLQSNSVPICLANPMGVRGWGCVLAALGFSLWSDFFAFCCLADFPPFLAQALATNRLSFLLLKTGFPGVERLNSQKRPAGRMAFLKCFLLCSHASSCKLGSSMKEKEPEGEVTPLGPRSPRGSPATMLYSTCPLGPESLSWARKVQTRGPGCPSVTSKGPS